MLVKYWKNFKWFLFIPLIVFIFVFKISNASALIYKGYEYSTDWSNSSQSCSGASCQLDFFLQNALPFTTDYIGIKISNFAYTDNYNINIGNSTTYCNNWTINNASTTQNGDFEYWPTSMSCYSSTTSGSSTDTLSNNNIMITAKSYNDNWAGSPCWLDSEFQDTFICPVQSNKFWFIRIFITGGSNDSYTMSLDRVKLLLNNDSTEIIQQQQTTNTNLQYIYQYQQDDSTTGSTTQATGDFTQLAQDFNTQLSGVNDLTQLVLLPISLFMDLSTDNCQPLHLQIPYVNMSVDLPCMKAVFNQYFNGLYSIFTTIMSAVICYWVAVKTGALVKEIVDCDNDRIEVVDL